MNPLFDAVPIPAGWQGVTARDQAEADRLIPELLAAAGVRRFVRVELGAGPIELNFGDSEGLPTDLEPFRERADLIGLVVAAGECGPAARPCHPAWLRSLRDQCDAAGVPFAFAGWGEWQPGNDHGKQDDDLRVLYLDGRLCEVAGDAYLDVAMSRELRPSPDAGGHLVSRVGSELSGRTLDGRTHDDDAE